MNAENPTSESITLSDVSSSETKRRSESDKQEDSSQSIRDPIHPCTVKKFLMQNPDFLDRYVQNKVKLSILRNWLENKERNEKEMCTNMASKMEFYNYNFNYYNNSSCPNANILSNFEEGQRSRNFGGPTTCRCSHSPGGSKEQRPYIIYALEQKNQNNYTQQFTSPRMMTQAEMGAFSQCYGFDLHNTMNMY